MAIVDLSGLESAVAEHDKVSDSAVELLDKLSTELKKALEETSTLPALQARVMEIKNFIEGNTTQLAGAVSRNTIAEDENEEPTEPTEPTEPGSGNAGNTPGGPFANNPGGNV